MLTRKLQQHPSSHLWLRHGQCCAACTATGDITGLEMELMIDEDLKKLSQNGDDLNNSSHENVFLSGNHNTNILYALTRASEIEEGTQLESRRRARRAIRAGNTVATVSIATGFIFFYYEYFVFALVGLIIGVAGIVLCRLAVWKKYRIEKL